MSFTEEKKEYAKIKFLILNTYFQTFLQTIDNMNYKFYYNYRNVYYEI